jgi:hypothetical protein
MRPIETTPRVFLGALTGSMMLSPFLDLPLVM